MSPSLGTPLGSGGGVSLGTPIGGGGGGGVPDRPRRRKKRRKKKDNRKRDFSALLQDIEDTAKGIGPGIFGKQGLLMAIGQAEARTIDKLSGDRWDLDRGSKHYMAADLGKAIVDSYTGVESPYHHLAKGDLGTAFDKFRLHPLSPILDVSAVFTGGGALAGKVGQKAALSGKSPADMGRAQLALTRAAGYTPRTAASYAAATRAGYGPSRFKEGAAFDPVTREVGAGYARRQGLEDGKGTVSKQAYRNPVLRGRQAAVAKVLDTIPEGAALPLPGGGRVKLDYLSSGERMARAERKVKGRNRSQREKELYLPRAERAANALKPSEKQAWFLQHVGVEPAEYRGMLQEELDTDLPDVDRKRLEAELKAFSNPDIDKAWADGGNGRVKRAVALTRELANNQHHRIIKDAGFMGDDANAVERALLTRRVLARRAAQGARSIPFHPEVREPTPGAARAQAALGKVHEEKVAKADPLLAEAAALRKEVDTPSDTSMNVDPNAPALAGDNPAAQQLAELEEWVQKGGWGGAKTRVRKAIDPQAGQGRVKVSMGRIDQRYGDVIAPRWMPNDGGAAAGRAVRAERSQRNVAEKAQVMEDVAWEFLRAFANDEAPNLSHLSDDWRPFYEGATKEDIAQLFADARLSKARAQLLLAAREQAAVMRRELDKEGDPFSDPNHPLFDPDADEADLLDDEALGRMRKDAEQLLQQARAMRKKGGKGKLKRAKALEARATRIHEQITVREQRLLARAEQTRPARLRDLRGYRDRELATSADADNAVLYRDLDRESSLEELAAQAEGAAYFPLRAAREKRRMGGNLGADPTVSRDPRGSSNLMKAASEYNLIRGKVDTSPQTLFDSTRSLIRLQQSSNLFDAALDMSVPLRAEHLTNTDDWVLLDKGKRQELARTAEEASATLKRLKQFAGEDRQLDALANAWAESAVRTIQKGEVLGDEVVAIPRSMYETLRADMRSPVLLERIIDRGLDVFRMFVLNLAPRWVFNDTIGSHLMLAAKHGGPGLWRGYLEYVGRTKSKAATKRVYRSMLDDVQAYSRDFDGKIAEKHGWELVLAEIAEVTNSGLVNREGARVTDLSQAMDRVRGGSRIRNLGTAAVKRAAVVPDAMVRMDSLLASDIPRGVLAIHLIRPEVRAMRQAEPHRFPKEVPDWQVAQTLLKERPAYADHLAEKVLRDLVDYSALTPFERTVLRRMIPFYSWFRGITVWTAQLGLEDPWRLAALVQTGAYGETLNDAQEAEGIPEHLEDEVWIGKPDSEGRQYAIGTQGANPWGTLAENVKALTSFAQGKPAYGSGTVNQMLNPQMLAIAEALSPGGRHWSSRAPMQAPFADPSKAYNEDGQPQPAGGVVQRWLGAQVNTMPQPQLYWKFRNGKSEYSIYDSPSWHYLASYFGVPIRRVKMDVAAENKEKERNPVVYSS